MKQRQQRGPGKRHRSGQLILGRGAGNKARGCTHLPPRAVETARCAPGPREKAPAVRLLRLAAGRGGRDTSGPPQLSDDRPPGATHRKVACGGGPQVVPADAALLAADVRLLEGSAQGAIHQAIRERLSVLLTPEEGYSTTFRKVFRRR